MSLVHSRCLSDLANLPRYLANVAGVSATTPVPYVDVRIAVLKRGQLFAQLLWVSIFKVARTA